MNTFNIFPALELKYKEESVDIVINEELPTTFKLNHVIKTMEVNRFFQLFNPVIQDFFVLQAIYSFELPEEDLMNNQTEIDFKAFHGTIDSYGKGYEGLLFLSAKLLFPEDDLKEERLSNLYYQLSNLNQ